MNFTKFVRTFKELIMVMIVQITVLDVFLAVESEVKENV